MPYKSELSLQSMVLYLLNYQYQSIMNKKNAVIEKVTYEAGSSIVTVAYENACFAVPPSQTP